MTNGEFKDKVMLVTGAASGLGRATAIALAGAGALVALADLNEAGLQETLVSVPGGRAFPCDLSDPAACRALIDDVRAHFGGIDGLCNAAGLLYLKRASETTAEQFDRLYAVNVRAPFLLFQAALPDLLARQGVVVNIASGSAFRGHAYMAAYAATKGAVVALTKSLAVEYAREAIRINCVAPGPIATPMASSPMPDNADMQLMMRGAGLRAIAGPEDLTDIILYLLSPRAKAIHGACFSVDQGLTT